MSETLTEVKSLEAANVSFGLQSTDFLTVVEVKDLEVDQILKKKAECLIGEVALSSEVKTELKDDTEIESNKIANLAEALRFADLGDKQAEHMVRSNVTTDYLERAYKSGFISEVKLEKRSDGEIIQFGQSIEDVHLNSLKHIDNPKLRERARVEALNSVRDKHYINSGLLKDNARITFSLVHEDMDDKEAEEVGFFVPTRSISIQLMTEKEDGSLVVQSAFVAGRENIEDEPFDKDAVVELAASLGIDYTGVSTEEILARPLLINKVIIPDLATSVVEKYDKAAENVTGKRKFFGLNSEVSKSHKDYIDKEQESGRIAKDLQSDIDLVVDSLKHAKPRNPVEATTKLAELNDKLLKKRIITDTTIDSRVLGTEAAYYIEHARALVTSELINQQQFFGELDKLQKIIDKADSSSCPGGASKKNSDLAYESEDENEISNDKPEDCEFVSKECPKCGEKNVKTECKNGVYYGACGCKSE